jgi:hopanoid biosynthesis associated RND transporter like protein HpnN
MLISIVRRIVELCSRHHWTVVAVALILATASGVYAVRNFAISTDINRLISPDLPWRQREAAYEKAFPGPFTSILVVVDAPTPELAAEATHSLTQRLSQQSNTIHSAQQLDGGPFLAKNGLLFQSEDDLARTTQGLGRAGPLIQTLASDPTLRGLTRALSLTLVGVQTGAAKLDDFARTFTTAADTVDHVLADQPASFSWHALMSGKQPAAGELRHFIDVRPVLDYAALEPGRAASNTIRQAADDLKLSSNFQARVRLTGPVAMADDEFSTVQEGAIVNSIATIITVLVILWLALRSWRIIVAVAATLFVGLAITAALGLMMVGALNLISIAFAVLFVGLGVDFGIQFAVRYRSERHENGGLQSALVNTAEKIGAPLTLAAAGVAAGFLSFFPTVYRGVSELGQIAGVGMLIAYVAAITVLPALLTILKPPGEPEEVGYRALAPIDRFLERHRIAVIGGTGLVALAGIPLLFHLTFDFNPINLRSPKVESVATYLDLRSDPNVGANAINLMLPDASNVAKTTAELRKIPEVDRIWTVQDFVPDNQERKLPMIRELARKLRPALQAEDTARAPTEAQTAASLKSTIDTLNKLAGSASGAGADAAKRLAASLTNLSQADKAKRDRVEATFIVPLRTALNDLRDLLQAEPVSLQSLPAELKREWISADGQTRIQAFPKGDPNDNETVRQFARAILAHFPNAVGTPISILESGDIVIHTFFQAGAFALVSISILLWIVLRRFGDVLLTLVPLILAGVITLEICVLIGMPLNFANIIALPLLLGVGVAFKIYYIMAWRAGQTDLLQSSLTRAVIWSALTTATAFGSLWLSSHPGTSTMGKLMALSLVCTMFAAVLFQPALMGKPRETAAPEPER